MTDAPRIAPADINKRLEAIAARTTTLQYAAEELSYAAVAGDQAALTRLEEIKDERSVLADEAKILDDALVAAERLERAEYEKVAAARREEAETLAKSLAVQIVKVCDQIDEVHRNQFLDLLRQLRDLEAQIKRPLVTLGHSLEGRTGQGELTGLARDLFRDRAGFEEIRPAGDLARNAWGYLLPGDAD